jgi:colicin import membrane protein
MTQPSSVMFSLQELARMEEERVRLGAEAAERERAAHDRERVEAEERSRAEQEATARAEAEARREVERRAREEAARIEAIHRASLEGARVEAEARARAEERERERRHEVELERARAAGRGGARGAAVAAVFGAVVAAGVALAVHYGVVAPKERGRAAEASAEIASRDVAIGDVRSHAEATEARLRALEGDLAAARAENDRLRADLEAARHPGGRTVPSHGPVVPPQPHPGPRLDGFTVCPPGSKDPLCLH